LAISQRQSQAAAPANFDDVWAQLVLDAAEPQPAQTWRQAYDED
jgi:hypothetical protein